MLDATLEGSVFMFKNEIASTGRFANSENYNSTGSVKAVVTPDGKGHLKDDENN